MEIAIFHRASEVKKFVDRSTNFGVIAHKILSVDGFWAVIREQPVEPQEYRCPIILRPTPYVQHFVQRDIGLWALCRRGKARGGEPLLIFRIWIGGQLYAMTAITIGVV